MLEVIWELAGGILLALGLVGLVLFLFAARRTTAAAHLIARGTVGKAARNEADPLAGLSFDERVAARLKDLGAAPASDASVAATPSMETSRSPNLLRLVREAEAREAAERAAATVPARGGFGRKGA